MSDQQQENEITTTQAAPAAPVASDQVATPVPAQASASEAPKPAPAAVPVAAEKAESATGEEAAPAKPKRTRRVAKPAASGDEAAKPKRRTTRTKRADAVDSSAPISDEVAQARALAQISEAQVVRARRRAAEREAAALTELASASEAPAVTEAPAADQPTENIQVHASHCGLGVNPSVMVAIADRLAQAEGQWQPFVPALIHQWMFPRTSID